MLEVIVNKLKALYNNCEIVVTSADPQDTEQKFGVIAPLARIIHKPSFSVEIV
ncbi:MAG: hypothetical protein U5O15_10640 [Candidatus Krumholzibacteriota bacterium]|nr:hypothetical protein [Candidatus Krumholzibacteriota bacterium]